MAKSFSEKMFVLNRAIVASIQSSSQEGIIKELLQSSVKSFGADYGYCFIKDDKNKFQLLYKTPGTPYEPQTPRPGGIISKTYASQKSWYITDVNQLEFVRKDAKQNMRGVAVIPISHKQSKFGVIVICYKKSHKFSEDERLMGEFLGNSAAQAIAINRLYIDLKDFKKTLDNTLDTIFIFDPHTLKLLYVNKGASLLTGIKRAQLLRKTLYEVNINLKEDDLREKIQSIKDRPSKNYLVFEGLVNHPERGKIEVEISLQHINEANQSEHFLAIVRDITERKQVEKSMARMAYFDQLTEIPNRAYLTEKLLEEHNLAKINKCMYSLFFIDLDRFKIINDIYGHPVGDDLLKQVAQRIKKVLPKKATLARMGGDEFIVLLPDVDGVGESEECARRILSVFNEFFKISEQEIYCNGSVGFAIFPLDGVDHYVVMKHADLALHRAKERGGGNYQQYHTGQLSFYTMQPQLQNQLRKALKRGEMVLHYQPVINVKTKKIIGAESLIRWNHPDRGLLYPNDFIGQAEESGLIIEIGEWVIHEVCRQIRVWEKEGRIPPPVSINVSPRELLRPTLVSNIDNALKKYKISPSQIKLELTETFLMRNIDLSISMLEQLKALGLRILIDDFGTGYASLNYLKRLPIDAVKVDRTFISGVPNSLQDAALTSAIIAISHQLGLEVIAEGVENMDQFDFLRAAQCNYAQGNFFFKPVDAQAFADLLHLANTKQMFKPKTKKPRK